MAKLKAYGRVEVFRVEVKLPDTDGATRRRETIAVMSDRVVLHKLTVHMRPDTYRPQGYAHTWGWKRHGRIKAGSVRAVFEKFKAAGAAVQHQGDFALVSE